MFKFYEVTLQGNEVVTLTYELENHRPAQVWAGLISKYKPLDLRPKLNPWRNFTLDVFDQLVLELNELIDRMNLWLPNKINHKWDSSNNQNSINKLHIHFPEQEKNETDINRRAQLTRFNDVIHELEALIANKNNLHPRLLLCFDRIETVSLENEDYKYFKPSRKFGELCLHYPHVGRHPFELYTAKDIDCPIEQIVPQTLISPDHTLRFHTDPLMDHQHTPNFKKFYENSTLKNVVKWNDPRMAFGYIPMGKVISTNNDELLTKISNCNKIVEWKVY